MGVSIHITHVKTKDSEKRDGRKNRTDPAKNSYDKVVRQARNPDRVRGALTKKFSSMSDGHRWASQKGGPGSRSQKSDYIQRKTVRERGRKTRGIDS